MINSYYSLGVTAIRTRQATFLCHIAFQNFPNKFMHDFSNHLEKRSFLVFDLK